MLSRYGGNRPLTCLLNISIHFQACLRTEMLCVVYYTSVRNTEIPLLTPEILCFLQMLKGVMWVSPKPNWNEGASQLLCRDFLWGIKYQVCAMGPSLLQKRLFQEKEKVSAEGSCRACGRYCAPRANGNTRPAKQSPFVHASMLQSSGLWEEGREILESLEPPWTSSELERHT